MEKEKFLKAIDTLKLYQRAELLNEQGKRLINDLYIDPLPSDHVLNTLLKPNTTFLIGRKGTGKSTIFQRAQEALNNKKDSTWAYIDIKTIYESSTSEIVGKIPSEFETALSQDTIQKICMFKGFFIDLIKAIKKQINNRITSSLLSQLKEVFTGSADELFENLDEFLEEIEEDKFLDITGLRKTQKESEESSKEGFKIAAEATTKISSNPSLQAKILAELFAEYDEKRIENYSQ